MTVVWARLAGELLAKMTREEDSKKREEIALEILDASEEKITMTVAFLCELARSAQTRDEVGKVVELAHGRNLLVVTESDRVKKNCLEDLTIVWEKRLYLPINPQDKRLQALVKVIRRSFSRVKFQSLQNHSSAEQ